MGVPKESYIVLKNESLKEPFKGSILQLGKQDISRFIYNKEISDIEFFKSMGFDSINSLDFSDYEGADIIGNLNYKINDIKEKYDCIYDGGTLEHCFDIYQVLKNIVKLCKIGGKIIHHNPSSGSLEHGFFMPSACLYYDFYKENGLEISKLFILRSPKWKPYKIEYYKYNPEDFKKQYAWDNNYKYYVYCIIKKIKEVNNFKIPTQGFYKNITKNNKIIKNNRLREFAINSPRIFWLYQRLKYYFNQNKIEWKNIEFLNRGKGDERE